MPPPDPEMRSPAVWEDGRANSQQETTSSAENHTTDAGRVQGRPDRLIGAVDNSLTLQISHLAARFALSKPTAVVVAELAFGEVAP
jgi:hypothetical protein